MCGVIESDVTRCVFRILKIVLAAGWIDVKMKSACEDVKFSTTKNISKTAQPNICSEISTVQKFKQKC